MTRPRDEDRCCVPRCQQEPAIIYAVGRTPKGICGDHWNRYGDDPSALREALGIVSAD